jgi:hypothetical protein
MNEDLLLEVVDLGDAKDLTKGPLDDVWTEDHPTQSRRKIV